MLKKYFMKECIHVCVLSHVWLFCNHMNCSLSGSSVHRIFQARILEWVAISYSRGSFQLRDRTCVSWVSCIGRQILYHCTPGKHSWTNKYNHFPGLSSSTRVILSPIFCLNLTKKWGRVTCKSNDFIPPLKFSEDHMSMSVQTLSKMSVLSFLSRPDAHKAPVWVLGVCSLHLLW